VFGAEWQREKQKFFEPQHNQAYKEGTSSDAAEVQNASAQVSRVYAQFKQVFVGEQPG